MKRKAILLTLTFVFLVGVSGMALADSSTVEARGPNSAMHTLNVGASYNQIGYNASDYLHGAVPRSHVSTKVARSFQENTGSYKLSPRQDGYPVRRTGVSKGGYYMYDSRNPNAGKIKTGGKAIHGKYMKI